MKTSRPSIRSIRIRQQQTGTSYIVGWRVPKLGDFSRAFRVKAPAEKLWRQLKTAAEDPTTRWDAETGLPQELRVATRETWADYVLEFIARQRELRPTSVRSLYDGIAIATVELLSPKARLTVGEARAIRAYLLDALVPGNDTRANRREHDEARRILRRHSLPLSDLNERTVVTRLKQALRTPLPEELQLARSARRTELVRKVENDRLGPPSTETVKRNTWLRRRSAVSAVITDAIEHGLLKENPLRSGKRTKRGAGTARAHRPGLQEVASATQVRLLARAISVVGRGSGRYFALIYVLGLVGLRPSEAYHLRRQDVLLPSTDGEWGTLLVCQR